MKHTVRQNHDVLILFPVHKLLVDLNVRVSLSTHAELREAGSMNYCMTRPADSWMRVCAECVGLTRLRRN